MNPILKHAAIERLTRLGVTVAHDIKAPDLVKAISPFVDSKYGRSTDEVLAEFTSTSVAAPPAPKFKLYKPRPHMRQACIDAQPRQLSIERRHRKG